MKALWTQWDSLLLEDDILYRKIKIEGLKEAVRQLVAPKEVRQDILHQLHNVRSAGHLGTKRVYSRLRQRFFWPHMKNDVKMWCRYCIKCAQRKPGPGRGRALMKSIPVGRPFERLAVDIMGPLTRTRHGNEYIMVVGDYFSKWVEAFAIPDHTAQTVADKLVIEVLLRYGCPAQLHSDQGREFESELMAKMCELFEIEKTRTTPYRPQSDGMVERLNRTIQDMLAMYIDNYQRDWDDHLPFVVSAYRNSIHESTGCTPNLIMFGHEISIPLDLMVGRPNYLDEDMCSVEYVEWLKQATSEAHKCAREQMGKSTARQKKYYDCKAKVRKYKPGDWVWRWYPPKGKLKFGSGWTGPFLIIRVISDVLIQIQFSESSPVKVVHIDHLKPYEAETLPVKWTCESGNIIDEQDIDLSDDND